ncbi:protein of unknown function (plasmid) [Pararobbsia alpina]
MGLVPFDSLLEADAASRKTIQDLFVHSLSNIYSSEKRLTRALNTLARPASSLDII